MKLYLIHGKMELITGRYSMLPVECRWIKHLMYDSGILPLTSHHPKFRLPTLNITDPAFLCSIPVTRMLPRSFLLPVVLVHACCSVVCHVMDHIDVRLE